MFTFSVCIVIENPGNDSLAFRTSFYDFRGEKERDKTKDMSDSGFKIGNYKTAKQRAEDQEKIHQSSFYLEKARTKDEIREKVMRPTDKLRVSPRMLQ